MRQASGTLRLALIGCGLMGGSFAMALRAATNRADKLELHREEGPGGTGDPASAHLPHHLPYHLTIAGYSRSRASAERAHELGIVDEVCSSVADAAASANVVLLAVPVTATEVVLREMAPHLSPDALVMDVGSTKRDVVAAARAALGTRLNQFVPAHPIAGKEHGGIDQAEAGLYAQRTCILTPLSDEATHQRFIERARTLWQAVGCRVAMMSPPAHDQTFAAVSHLPHLLAFAYVNGLAQQQEAARHLALAGPGFRDFSRIAAGTSAIWRDIFSANRDEVLAQLQHFEAALADLRAALERGDDPSVARLVDQASAVRSGWRLNGAPLPGDDPT